MTARRLRFDLRQAGRPIAAVLGILGAINLVAYFLLVQPAVREYRRLTEERGPTREINEREAQVVRNEEFLTALGQVGADLGTLRGDLLSTRAERLVEVQGELDELCRRFGIDLKAVGVESEMMLDEELDRLAMNVPLEGNYANLRRFLQAVEQSDQFLIVERVSLARGKEGGALLSLNVGLATYFTAPEELVERKRAMGRQRGTRK